MASTFQTNITKALLKELKTLFTAHPDGFATYDSLETALNAVPEKKTRAKKAPAEPATSDVEAKTEEKPAAKKPRAKKAEAEPATSDVEAKPAAKKPRAKKAEAETADPPADVAEEKPAAKKPRAKKAEASDKPSVNLETLNATMKKKFAKMAKDANDTDRTGDEFLQEVNSLSAEQWKSPGTTIDSLLKAFFEKKPLYEVATVDLTKHDEVEFEGENYLVNPETKMTYLKVGTSYKYCGIAGQGALAHLDLEEAAE